MSFLDTDESDEYIKVYQQASDSCRCAGEASQARAVYSQNNIVFFSENFDKSVSNFLTSPSLNCDIMTNYSSSNWGQSTCDLWAHGYRYLRVDLRI